MDEHSQSRRFDDMREQIEQINAKQDATSKNVYEILAILRGDDFADGMVVAVKDHEARIKKMEELKSRATWTILGMSIPSGYGLVELLKRILPPLIILVLFTGCLSQKKREDIFHRHAREHKADVLDYCPPPSIVYKPGETITDITVVTDSVPVYLDGDTVWVECPEHEVRHTSRVDTVTVTDEAALEASELRRISAENALAHERGRNEQLNVRVEELESDYQKQWWISVGLGVAILLGGALWVVGRFKIL